MTPTTIEVIVEIPLGSAIKYEYNRRTHRLEVDRILVGDFKYPANYGFVPTALDYDGDELDVLVYSPHVFHPGVALRAHLVGAMKMIDDGETDTKLIAVHADDKSLAHIKSLSDLPQLWITNVEQFFSHYKDYKRPGIVQIAGFEGAAYAAQEYAACTKLMEKYGHLPKAEFIALMKKLHPDKYTM